MPVIPSHLTRTHSPAREAIFLLLLGSPHQEWTVRLAMDALGDRSKVSIEAVRATLYVLLADGILTTVCGRPGVSMRLTSGGITTLAHVVAGWRRESHQNGRC